MSGANFCAVDWRKTEPVLRERIVVALDDTIMPNLRSMITDAFYMTPEDFKTVIGQYMGRIFDRTNFYPVGMVSVS